MNTIALRKHVSLAAAASALLMSVSLSAQAQQSDMTVQTAPLGLYGGVTAGIGINNWKCDVSCDRAVFSGKLFGGKRLTPGLAAEINYIVFGQTQRSNSQAATAALGYAIEKRKVHAYTLGINWEVELLNSITNQLRFGWAAVEQKNTRTLAGGALSETKNHLTAPYLGAGLAFQLTRQVKLLTSADFIIKGHESQYLVSAGASAEF